MPSFRRGRSVFVDKADLKSSQQAVFSMRRSGSQHSLLSVSNYSVDSSAPTPHRAPSSYSTIARERVQRDLSADEFPTDPPSSQRAHEASHDTVDPVNSPISLGTSTSSSRNRPFHATASTELAIAAALEEEKLEKYAARAHRPSSGGRWASPRTTTVTDPAAPPPPKLRSHRVVEFVPGTDSGSRRSHSDDYGDEQGSHPDNFVDEEQPSASSSHNNEQIYEAELAVSNYGDVVERVVHSLMSATTPAQSVQRVDDDRRDDKSERQIDLSKFLCICGLVTVMLGAIVIILILLLTRPDGPNISTQKFPSVSPSSPQTQPPTMLTESPVGTSQSQEQELAATLGTVWNMAFFDSPESAQYKAFHWLLTNDGYVLSSRSQVLERFVLAVLYFSIEWPDWEAQYRFLRNDTHHCEWKGYNSTNVLHCNEDKLVVTLRLEGHYLPGTVPSELQHLTMLRDLGLYGNELTGTVPSELGTMVLLTDLDLSHNHLRGTIPSTLFGLPRLRVLELQWNELTGLIPSNIGDARLLEFLGLYTNQLTGFIPSSIINMASLEEIELDNNVNLRGPIPSFRNSRNLRTIYLNGNRFTGTIPTDLMLYNRKLELLDLSDNRLEGTVPTEIGLWTDLQYLWLEDNLLTGAFPSLKTCPELQRVEIYDNDFTGRLDLLLEDLPPEIVWIRYDNNSFTGTIPEWIGSRSRLQRFGVAENHLSGTIPSELGLLTLATTLDLFSNQLKGTVPTELGGLGGALSRLTLKHNLLEGTVPSELGRLTQLTQLEVNNNNLIGSIPSEVGSLTSLTFLDVCCNSLSETIPTDLSKLSLLSQLYLEENMLTGSIPPSWSANGFPDLIVFHMYENNLTGDLNEGFCDLDPELEMASDCLDPDAEMECSCCVLCCNRTNDCVFMQP